MIDAVQRYRFTVDQYHQMGEDFYRTAHPTPEDALLVVEVAHTSLARDRRRKLPLYARTGVSEVWIVNRRPDAVDVFRGPSREGYRDQFRCGRGGELAPSAFPDLRLSVDDVLALSLIHI